MRNTQQTKHISEYPINPEFDFRKLEFTGKNISGELSFVQMIQKFILTERYKYKIYSDKYGIEESVAVFSTRDTDEFSRQCSNIAAHLLETHSEWIQEIYRIYRKNDELVIEMKVKGKPDTLKCVIPNMHKA